VVEPVVLIPLPTAVMAAPVVAQMALMVGLVWLERGLPVKAIAAELVATLAVAVEDMPPLVEPYLTTTVATAVLA
jgi:hypothetical protein